MQVDITVARAQLTSLSELLRYSLTKNDETPVTLSEEVEMVQKYMQILACDETMTFSIETDIPAKLHAFAIPPMLLLNLCVLGSKYGGHQSSSDKKLKISVIELHGKVQIMVSFNGELEQLPEAKSIESTLKQRLFLLNGISSSYDVNLVKNITSIIVSIPNKVNLELNNKYGLN